MLFFLPIMLLIGAVYWGVWGFVIALILGTLLCTFALLNSNSAKMARRIAREERGDSEL